MKLQHLLIALLVTGCTYLPQANVSRGQSIVVKAKIAESNLTTQTVVNPYTAGSINHLLLQLMYMPSQSVVSSVDIPGSQLSLPVKLTNLAANRSYRIKATAYKASGTLVGDVISTGDALSQLDFATTNNDQPTIVTLPVKLIDKDFNGIATSTIAITSGGYSFAASESVAFLPPLVTTFAGTNQAGYADGTLAQARFSSPSKIARNTSTGILYITDTGNNNLRRISGGTVGGLGAGKTGIKGIFYDSYDNPGRLMISANTEASEVNMTTGAMPPFLTLANPIPDLICMFDGIDSLALALLQPTGLYAVACGTEQDILLNLNNPQGMTANLNSDVLYIADTGNNRILKYTGIKDSMISMGEPTLVATYGDGTAGTSDGSASTARFNAPRGLALDSHGNLYVSDTGNHRIRCIEPSGNVTTYAGPTGAAESGFADGVGTAARFKSPDGLTVDGSGNLYVVDTGNHCIRYLKRIY